MSTRCPTCSQSDTSVVPALSRVAIACEALNDETASRNASEPGSASLRKSGVANLPKMAKPATGKGNPDIQEPSQTPRAGRGQRAVKEQHRNLGESTGGGDKPQQAMGNHNHGTAPAGKSEGFIVAMKEVMTLERRDLTADMQRLKWTKPLELMLENSGLKPNVYSSHPKMRFLTLA